MTRQSPLALGAAERKATAWLIGILSVQLACQWILMVEQFASLRVVFRTATFLVSAAGLVLIPIARGRHPSALLGYLIVAIVGLNVFHPTTNTLLVGVAQTALYLAILRRYSGSRAWRSHPLSLPG